MTRLERTWKMTRIGPGDYLLPSNDQTILWRITRYHEDGSASVSGDGVTWRKVVGTRWSLAKFEHAVQRDFTDEILDWGHWQHWESMLMTRGEAIEAALSYEARGVRA